jgi:hypothetical protein
MIAEWDTMASSIPREDAEEARAMFRRKSLYFSYTLFFISPPTFWLLCTVKSGALEYGSW